MGADEQSVQNSLLLNGSLFRGRQLKVTVKRTNVPGFFKGGDKGKGKGKGKGKKGKGKGYKMYDPWADPYGGWYGGGYKRYKRDAATQPHHHLMSSSCWLRTVPFQHLHP